MITLHSTRFLSESQLARHPPLQPRRAPSSLRGHRRSRSSRVYHLKIITGQGHGRSNMVPVRQGRIPGRRSSIWRVRGRRVHRAMGVRRRMNQQGYWTGWYSSTSRRKEIQSRGSQRAIAPPSQNHDLGPPVPTGVPPLLLWPPLCFVTHPTSTPLSFITHTLFQIIPPSRDFFLRCLFVFSFQTLSTHSCP